MPAKVPDEWMDGWMGERTDGWMDGWTDGWMGRGWMDGDGWMDGWMHGLLSDDYGSLTGSTMFVNQRGLGDVEINNSANFEREQPWYYNIML